MDELEQAAAREGRWFRTVADTYRLDEDDLIWQAARLEDRVAGLEEWMRMVLLTFGNRGLETEFLRQQESRIRGETVAKPSPPEDPGLL